VKLGAGAAWLRTTLLKKLLKPRRPETAQMVGQVVQNGALVALLSGAAGFDQGLQ